MLRRYHIVNIIAILALGLIGNWAMPQLNVMIPWTGFLILLTGASTFSLLAFAGAARYASPTLASETFRLSRFPEATKYASDGTMMWAGVPCTGWNYMKRWLSSGGNNGIAIFPASMLEQESEFYTVARCMLYLLTPRAVNILMKKRSLRRMFAELGWTADKKMDIYFGFQSRTLHSDKTHVQSPRDLEALARNLRTSDRLYTQVSKDQDEEYTRRFKEWEMFTGSPSSRRYTRSKKEEDDEE